MRPETFNQKVTNGINRWLRGHGNVALLALLPVMKRYWKVWADREPDHRSGEETYGYGDQDSIYWNMTYISDRWRCAFRLKWLIDGLENGTIGPMRHKD